MPWQTIVGGWLFTCLNWWHSKWVRFSNAATLVNLLAPVGCGSYQVFVGTPRPPKVGAGGGVVMRAR